MIASAHQSVYHPWLPLLHKASQADIWIVWDDVPMESSGFENRQYILGRQLLTVPVHRGRDVKIKDVTIANDQGWQRKHMRTIELVYSKARFWSQYEPMFRYLYEQQTWNKLIDLNEQILTFLFQEFDVRCRRVLLSSLGTTSHKAEQVLEACKKVGAYKYIFGAKGPDYADPAPFREAGVEPFVQVYTPQPYDQVGGGAFQPNLWAFDVLLNKGPEEGRDIMLAGGTVQRMG